MAEENNPELLGVETNQSRVDTTADFSGTSPWVSLLSLLLVAASVFGLVRAVATRAQASQASDEVVTAPAETELVSTTVAPAIPAPPSIDPQRRVVEGQPFFAQETGWDLFVGSVGPLRRLKLDTGGYTEFAVDLDPVLVVGEYLLVETDSGNLEVVTTINPDGDTRSLGLTSLAGRDTPAVMTPQDEVWLLGGDPQAPVWQLWAVGEIVSLESEVPMTAQAGELLHPSLNGSPAGGVFSGLRGATEKVADGRLVGVTTNHIVVEQCSSPFNCAVLWLSRDTWETDSSIVVPEVTTDLVGVISSSPTGERVVVPSTDGTKRIVWNLQTGTPEFDEFVSAVVFSPDGRFAAGKISNSDLAVVDLDTGEVRTWGAPRLELSSMLFVAADS